VAETHFKALEVITLVFFAAHFVPGIEAVVISGTIAADMIDSGRPATPQAW
jgi:hypothetical protein